MNTSPDVAGTMPAAIFTSVLFPAPFSPTTAWMRPASKLAETPLTARRAP